MVGLGDLPASQRSLEEGGREGGIDREERRKTWKKRRECANERGSDHGDESGSHPPG